MKQFTPWLRQLLASGGLRLASLFGIFLCLQISLILIFKTSELSSSLFYFVLILVLPAGLVVAGTAWCLRRLGFEGSETWLDAVRLVALFPLTAAAFWFFFIDGRLGAPKPGDGEKIREEIRANTIEAQNLSEAYRLQDATRIFDSAEKLASKLSPDALAGDTEGAVYRLRRARAKHEFRGHHFARSLELALQAARTYPKDPEIIYLAGLLRLELSRKASAKATRDSLRFFDSAFALDPAFYPALVQWARIEARTRPTYAELRIRALLKQTREPKALYWALGEVYEGSGRKKEALKFYEKALKKPLSAFAGEIFLAEGRTRAALGQMGRAAQSFESAFLADPPNQLGLLEEARIFYSMKRFFEAERTLLRLLFFAPEFPGARSLLGQVYVKLGQAKLAKSTLEKNLVENPNALTARMELAGLYYRSGAYGEAVDLLKHFVGMPLNDATAWIPLAKESDGNLPWDLLQKAHLLIAQSYQRLGKKEEARTTLKKGIEFFGDEEGRQLAQALKRLK